MGKAGQIALVGFDDFPLADIVDRRKLLLATQLWMLTSASALAALTLLDLVTPTVLLGLTFAMGVGGALMGPAWQAIQPDLVPPAQFPQAVALSILFLALGTIGNLPGGLIYALDSRGRTPGPAAHGGGSPQPSGAGARKPAADLPDSER